MTYEEVVPGGRAIWQSDKAKTYQCPFCLRPVFSQYEGNELPVIVCEGWATNDGVLSGGGHRLQWEK